MELIFHDPNSPFISWSSSMATGVEGGSEPWPIRTLPPVGGFQASQTHDPSFPSDPQALEWEAKVQTWLAELPAQRNATASEMDEWIDSNPSSLPESLLPLPRSRLHARILYLHTLLCGSTTNQMSGSSNAKYKKTLEWNQKEHYAFISAYAEACRKGHRRGKALDEAGYTMVADLIKAKCGITVNEKAIRSHYEKSKYFLKGWIWLCRYTGLGWDDSKNTFIATPEIWEQFKKDNKTATRLQKWGYTPEMRDLLYYIFEDMVAASPISLQNEPTPEEQGWGIHTGNKHPREELHLNSQHEPNQHTPPVRTTPNSHKITSQIPTIPSVHTRIGPRRGSKRRQSEAEVSSAWQSLSEAMLSRNEGVNEANAIAREQVALARDLNKIAQDTSEMQRMEYRRVVELMTSLPGYNLEDEMYTTGLSLFMDKEHRSLFLSMEGRKDLAEAWLRGVWAHKQRGTL